MVVIQKIFTGLSLLVVAGFGALLVLSLLVPIYTDEITSKMQLMRALVEGGRFVSILPQCEGSWVQPLAISWYPAAAYYRLLFLPLGLLGHKLAAIGLTFGWFFAVACAIARSTPDWGGRLRRLATFVALHAAGTVPLALVTARAEPTMVIALGAFVAFPLWWPIEARRTLAGRLALASAFVLVTSIFFFSAYKALLFTPLVVLSAVLTFRRSVRWLVFVLAFVALTAFETNAGAKRFIACDEAPIVQAVLRSITLDPGRLLRDPAPFLLEGLGNLRGRSIDVAEGMSIVAPHPWLPPATAQDVPVAVTYADRASRALLYLTILGVPGWVALTIVRAWRRPRARVPAALGATLLACLAGHVFLAHHWNYYMSPLVVGVLGLIAVVAASATPRPDHEALERLALLGGILLQATASAIMITTLAHVGPRLVALARLEGTVLPGQPAYVPALGYDAERPKIRAHAARCSIRGDGARRLVVDDATLFAFEDLREPLHLIYVTDAAMWGYDVPGQKDIALLRRLGASGIISRCSYFPTALEERAKRQDGYCCVSAEDLR